jgi:hypothetical protein
MIMENPFFSSTATLDHGYAGNAALFRALPLSLFWQFRGGGLSPWVG